MTHADEEEVLARIAKGLVYTESEAAFQAPRRRTEQIFEYNHTPPSETEKRRSLLVTIFSSVGERTVLLPPFHAGFGSNVPSGPISARQWRLDHLGEYQRALSWLRREARVIDTTDVVPSGVAEIVMERVQVG